VSDDFNFSTGMPSDEMAQYVQMFVDETTEQLDELVEVLLVLENNPDSPNHLNESFRLIHSIKGAAAMMGLDSITLLTHHLENHFERFRSGLEVLDTSLMNLILKCVDFLRNAVETLREGRPLVSAPELIEQLSKSAAEIRMAVEQSPEEKAQLKQTKVNEPVLSHPGSEDKTSTAEISTPSTSNTKRIIIYFDRAIELPELKAELIIARLTDLAIIHRTSPDIDELASLADLGTLQIWLESPCDDSDLRSTADIVGVDLVEIDTVEINTAEINSAEINTADIETANEPTEQAVFPEQESSLGVGVKPAAAAPEVTPALALPEQLATPNQADSTEIAAAEVSPKRPPSPDAIESQTKVVETLRVDIQRLDRLMNLAGELVVNRARFVQLASQMTDTFKKSGLISHLRDLCDLLRESFTNEGDAESSSHRTQSERYGQVRETVIAIEEQLRTLEQGRKSFLQLKETIDQFSRVSDGLQRGVLDTRMVPVGPLFNRFKRTVRDISTELKKKVHFVIRGENTELDKRMIDELGDPLVHLVRNAIDHGLESESVRASRGKPETGSLTLEASHSGNNVLITISDDGGGINIEKVRRRAIERSLITSIEAEMLSDHEIAQFIWAPGFSTAETVSDISGRGVGMDIVKTRISELNGTIEVDSTLGKGTRFIIRLPLTLAIIRSLLFQLPQGTFAAPIENVREIVSIRSKDVISVHGRDSIEVRGEFIPLVRIEDVFDWHQPLGAASCDRPTESEAPLNTMSVLILNSGTKSMGMVVGELKGCQDIVVKSLDENFTHIRGLAGASILGDGSVCLLLDIVSCLELARQRLRDRSISRSIVNS
jgi:two-component system chemotaxis sensor kinase CheA